MCTPTKLNSSDANGLLDGLEFTQPDDRLVVLIREFEKLDCVVTVTWAIDGAYSNERLYAYSEALPGSPAMHRILCQNHREHLVEVTAKQCIGKPIVDTVFDLATLMRSGGFHLRFCGSVLKALRASVRWHATRLPAVLRTNAFGEALKSFSIENHGFFKHGWKKKGTTKGKRTKRKRSRDDQQSKSILKLHQSWDTLLKIAPGGCMMGNGIDIYGVPEEEQDAVLKDIGRSAITCLLKSVVGKPEHGKWTKLTPTLEYIFQLIACGRLIEHMMEPAMEGLDAKPREDGEDAGTFGLSWRATASVKAKEVKSKLQDTDFIAKLTVMTLALEPTKLVTAFFLNMSEDQRPTCRINVLDLIRDESSLIVHVMQELRLLGSGLSPRCALLCGVLGLESLDDMLMSPEHRQHLRYFVKFVRMVSACTFRRCDLPRQARPLCDAALVDGRLPRASRLAHAQALIESPNCCRGRFWERMLFADNVEAEDLLNPTWQAILNGFVNVINKSLTIANLERKNKRTQTLLSQKDIKFENLVAMSVVKEGQAIASRARERNAAVAEQRGLALTGPTDDMVKKPKRALSALELYRADKGVDERAGGQPMNKIAFSQEWRQQQRNNFNAEPLHVQEEYHALAESQKVRAREERRAYRHACAQVLEARTDNARLALTLGDVTQGQAAAIEHLVPLQACCLCSAHDAPARAEGCLAWHPPPLPLEGCCGVRPGDDAQLVVYEAAVAGDDGVDGDHQNLLPISAEEHVEIMNTFPNRLQAELHFNQLVTVAAEEKPRIGKVQYARTCGPICKKEPMCLRRLEARLLKTLDDIVSGLPTTHQKVGMEEVFLNLLLDHDSELANDIVVSLDFASAKSGPHLPTQTFTLFKKVETSQGSLLVPLGTPHVHVEVSTGKKNIDQRVAPWRRIIDATALGTYFHVSERLLVQKVLSPMFEPLKRLGDAFDVDDWGVSVRKMSVAPARWHPDFGVPLSYDIYWYDDMFVVELDTRALPTDPTDESDERGFLEDLAGSAGFVHAGDELEMWLAEVVDMSDVRAAEDPYVIKEER